MLKNFSPALFLFLIFASGFAQELSIRVIDSKSGEGLPQATIQINGSENLVANAEGNFKLSPKFNKDDTMLSASYLGYNSATLTVAAVKANGYTIRLQAVVYELQNVDVKSVNRHPDSIMAAVKRNLAANYKYSQKPVQSKLFFRQSSVYKPLLANIEMSKSTKVKKADLNAVNAELKKFASDLIAHPPREASDVLCNYFTAIKTFEDKPVVASRFTVDKAVNFKEDKRAMLPDEIEKKGLQILMKHLDSTKYYRIKSGIFGTRDTVVGGDAMHKKKKENPNLNAARSGVVSFLSKNNISQGYGIDFVRNPQLYEYTFAGTAPYGTDGYVYKLNFKPRKRKAKYAGVLYISQNDYAVVRAEYDLAEGKTKGGINLKWILGIKQVENVSRGILIYKQKDDGVGYYLKYASSEEGQYVYINRPLKFVEITDDDKEKVAYDLQVEIDVLDKEEYINLAREEIAEADFDKVKETEFTYLEPDVYDAGVWKPYLAVDPVDVMRTLKNSQ